MTQNDLAEKMNVTDKAVSKWEQGLSVPDAEMLKCRYRNKYYCSGNTRRKQFRI